MSTAAWRDVMALSAQVHWTIATEGSGDGRKGLCGQGGGGCGGTRGGSLCCGVGPDVPKEDASGHSGGGGGCGGRGGKGGG